MVLFDKFAFTGKHWSVKSLLVTEGSRQVAALLAAKEDTSLVWAKAATQEGRNASGNSKFSNQSLKKTLPEMKKLFRMYDCKLEGHIQSLW